MTQLAAGRVDLTTLMNMMGHTTTKLAMEVYATADADVAHGAHGVVGPERGSGE